jgi:hypothetical protein
MQHHIVNTMGVAMAALGIAGLAAACSSSTTTSTTTTTSSTHSGTETLSGTITGQAAIKTLENQNSNAPLIFPKFTWSGVVNTTAVNESIGSGGNGTEYTFPTPAGDFALIHTSKNQNGTGSATGPVRGVCSFKDVTSGTYTVVADKSTGSFNGATGHGTFAITITGTGPITPKATKCTVGNNGPNVGGIKSASIAFSASGPLTVKS